MTTTARQKAVVRREKAAFAREKAAVARETSWTVGAVYWAFVENFGPRIGGALVRGGFRTVDEVRAATNADLLKVRHVGKKSIAEIRSWVPPPSITCPTCTGTGQVVVPEETQP